MNDTLSFDTLAQVLLKKYDKKMLFSDCQTIQLHGGTLGDVKLITGTAKAADGTEEPFSLVWKKQKKWERLGDPQSWRREYDLYSCGFSKAFSESFRIPECYHAEINADEMQLWLEFIDGLSGTDLTNEMLEQAAQELGTFQGRISRQHNDFKAISCFGDTGFLAREFNQWHTQAYTYDYLLSETCRLPIIIKQMLKDGAIQLTEGKSFAYSALRSECCEIPSHLKQMIIDIDENRNKVFAELEALPVVLCHRDFWLENIFSSDGSIVLIDWDGAGFGYLGEDIASLIVDDTETENLHPYFRRLIPAYCRGISQYLDIPLAMNKVIWQMIVIKFGYRIVQKYLFVTSDDAKKDCINRLQRIYEMKDMQKTN